MSDIKALVGEWMQNPQAVTSLVASAVKDPKALARAAGVTDQQLSVLSGFGGLVSGLLRSPSSSTVAAADATPDQPTTVTPAPSSGSSTAVVAVVGLVAVTGAIAILGTVSAVALSKQSSRPQS